MAKLKALPKALIVGVIIAGTGFGVMRFMPKHVQAPPPIQVTEEIPPPNPPAAVPDTTAAQVSIPEPAPNVTTGSAGMEAVLKAGKK